MEADAGRTGEEDGDGVGGVRGVRAAGLGVAHKFGVAVVCGDQKGAALTGDGVGDAAQAGVDGFDRHDGGRQAAGMADHVGVGEVHDDQVVFAGVDGLDGAVGQFGSGHFGLQVVGRDLGRGHHDAVFARVGCLLAAVEEVGDVRVFFRLGHAQLGAAGVGDHFAEDAVHGHRREQRAHAAGEIVAVLGHADSAGGQHETRAGEAVKTFVEEGGEEFADAIGAEVEAEQDVALLDPRVGADDAGGDEFVGDVAGVGASDDFEGGGEAAAFAQSDG